MRCIQSAYLLSGNSLLILCFGLLMTFLPERILSQNHAQDDTTRSAVNDTIPLPQVEPVGSDTIPYPAAGDTIPTAPTETPGMEPFQQNGIPQQPSTPAAQRTATPDAVNFQSRDSLVFRARENREAVLYGSANVRHTENELRAGKISLYLNLKEVHAQSDDPADTLAYPVLKQGSRDLKSSRILFNYETEKGKFDAAEVQVDDGYLIGNKVKNVSRTEVFIEEGKYSTCPPTHMYYYIQAQRMKVVDEDEIFFTNARLFLLDIPYPLVFPFGYVPAGIDRRRSGLLEPTYVFQNTSRRGIGFQNLGWFQYFNDYFVGQTSFDLFTSGSLFNETRFQYRKTGNFNGTITLGYSSERGLEPTDQDFTETINKRVSVQHSQDLSPYASLNANINFRTADYYQRNSYDIDDRAETSSSSSLTYRYRHPENLFNFNVSNRLNQQFSTNTTRLSGPQMSFSLRQFNPFERDDPTITTRRFYETISVQYSNNFEADYNFRPVDGADAEISWIEALLDPAKYREATNNDRHIKMGFRQRGQISANNLIPSQHLNVSSSFNINEYWYPSSLRREWNEEQQIVEERRESGFITARDFSTGLNFSTTIYGISQMRIRNLEGFRHTLRPTVGFSYSPDFGEERWGNYREVQVDTLGNTQTYSIFRDEVYGGPSRGEQMNLNFGISNVFETKQVKRDSTGEVQSNNLRIIDNLSINSSYNFAADSLNFSQVRASMSTRIIEGVNITMSANFSLYARNSNGREINRFIWQETGKYLQPLSYSISANYSIRGSSRGMSRVSTPMYRPYDPLDQSLFGPVDARFNEKPVQNFSSPFQASFSFSYRWNYRFGQDANKSATLNVNNIRFNLTPKWSVSTRIGYDFIDRDLTPSQFALNRRMECWSLSFQFNPFGDFQYYFFRLSIDSGQIQSLFQKLPLLNNLERSSSPTGRAPRF